MKHQIVKNEFCYYCVVCQTASGDADGLVGQDCNGAVYSFEGDVGEAMLKLAKIKEDFAKRGIKMDIKLL